VEETLEPRARGEAEGNILRLGFRGGEGVAGWRLKIRFLGGLLPGRPLVVPGPCLHHGPLCLPKHGTVPVPG
jgi:hypothetical protein